MPTTNPRITVTLKPSVHAVLRRMGELTKQSQSAIVGDLLATSEPVFARMVRVLEAAQAATERSKNEVRQGLDKAQGFLEKQLGLMDDFMEDRATDFVSQLETVERRGPRGTRHRSAPRGPTEPPSLTGGSQPRKPNKNKGRP